MSEQPTSYEDEHEAFAASRSCDYVFAPAKDHFFTTLDLHADTIEGDVKLPLIVVGDEGSGKSALLANWVAKRKLTKHKDEFLFQHYVDSSSQNSQLSHVLSRLETNLKFFFQLREMDVPDSEERLRWSLSRFLSAAVKKKSPARIVIVIDGVNKIRGEGCRDGELYWLPTELPPCVRFIVSTVEHDRATKQADDISEHRTYVELKRRNCPMFRMEPLSIATRHSIINSYCALGHSHLELQEGQQFRIVTSAQSSQPLYLRTLLQSLSLGLTMTTHSKDHLLDAFLRCSNAFEMTEKILNLCIFSITNEAYVDLLGKVLTVVYVSRNGLSEDEVWGIVKRVSKVDVDELHQQKLMAILKSFTMVVNDLHSFSHEMYREVVYDKFICSNETFIRWHNLMARYFGQLPTCARKLTCLPFHLEVAGSWNKVKNCLTDIEMFNLWWTPNFKKDFIKYWSSLTATKTEDSGPPGTPQTNPPNKKPTYDIVEEYVKSMEEFRGTKFPKDEVVSETILRVGEFLIEFAVQGHEKNADVPINVHPVVPSADLASLGVPHVEYDEEGRSVLVMPMMTIQADDGTKTQGDAPVTANEDLPLCTTYFFARWMWIQFPLIALGNCDQRYLEGIKIRQANNPWERDEKKKKKGVNDSGLLLETVSDDEGQHSPIKHKPSLSQDFGKVSLSMQSLKLPQIQFVKKVARSIRRVPNPDAMLADIRNGGSGQVDMTQHKIMGLQDTNRDLRDELDFCVQQRMILSKRLVDVELILRDLNCSADSTTMYDKDLQIAAEQDTEAAEKLRKALFVNGNLQKLLIMCERHPAHSPATIFEVEKKLEQDSYILHEIKSRLWEQKFEQQVHQTAFRKAKMLVKDGLHMHTKLLDLRYDKKRELQNEQTKDLRESTSRVQRTKDSAKSRQSKRNQFEEITSYLDDQERVKRWNEKWQIISSRTGITDPDIFFQRLNYGGALEDQINNLKRHSETRRDALKNELTATETELEDVRSEASILGGQSREVYEKHKEVSVVQQKLRRAKERTEASELQMQQVIAGLNHINEILGVNHSDQETNIADVIRDIEGVLETLVEENEKQQQGQGGVDSPSLYTRTPGTRDGTGNIDGHIRPSELENALTKFQEPKARVANSLPSRPVDQVILSGRDGQNVEDDIEDEGTWSRRFMKHQSFKTLKQLSKKKVVATQDLSATA